MTTFDFDLFVVGGGSAGVRAARMAGQRGARVALAEAGAMGGKALVLLKISNVLGNAGAPDPARVFNRYYRGEGAKQQVGTGLGLWLSQVLALKLGSRIECAVDGPSIHFCMKLELS
jgi:signal transduction histidine kinase